MAKFIALLYGITVYFIFLLVNIYFIGFLGNFPVVKSIDSGPEGNIVIAFMVDSVLLSIFSFSHSIMAREGFKSWWIKIVPESIERSTYVLVSCVSLVLLFWGWQPVKFIVWDVKNSTCINIIWMLFAAGWVVATISTFMVNHFDLFGLRQVYDNFLSRRYSAVEFKIFGFYKIMRHPIMAGFLLAFWATPQMSAGHLFFSAILTIYIFIAVQLEERDLVSSLGDVYIDYKKKTNMIFPGYRRNKN